ncbi:hypothetical protein HYU18_03835, partial [Candidatus Woesearchaeota archaeon]|nr:hypothetical protein [Candidatus Woesearchaeota archaeon]
MIVVLGILLILNFWGGPRKIAYAGFDTANKVTDDIGLDELISDPQILGLAFGHGSLGELELAWSANKDAQNLLEDGDIKVEFHRRELPGADPKPLCTAYRLEFNAEENPDKSFRCDVNPDGVGSAKLVGGESLASPKPVLGGEFTVVVGLRGKDDSGFYNRKDGTYRFFMEDFVELLDKPIADCKAVTFSNCNVIACKKSSMEALTEPGLPEVEKIANAIISGSCAKYDKTKSPRVDFSGCTNEQVDKLNSRFARLAMFRAAREVTGTIKSEDEYGNYPEKLGDFMSFAIDESLKCSKGAGIFKGVYGHLEDRGWKPVGDLKERETAMSLELNTLLDNMEPVIGNLRAFGSGRKLTLAWEVIVGKNSLSAYYMEVARSQYAPDKALPKDSLAKFFKDKKITFIPITVFKTPGKPDLSVQFPDGKDISSSEMGTYWFKLTPISSYLGETREVAVGIYDNQYVEWYRDGEKIDDACGGDCNVAGKKESALGDNDLGWKNLPGKAKKPEETYVYVARCGSSEKKIDSKGVTACPEVPGKFKAG